MSLEDSTETGHRGRLTHVPVNHLALLAPSRLAAVGHSLRTRLFPATTLKPRPPAWGWPGFLLPSSKRRWAVVRPISDRLKECPANLIPGVLTLCPKTGMQISCIRGRRSRVPGATGHCRATGTCLRMLLLTPTSVRTAVPRDGELDGLSLAVPMDSARSSSSFRSDSSPNSTTGLPRCPAQM
jgi:hypothetical protein